jgi:hypothetical protein
MFNFPQKYYFFLINQMIFETFLVTEVIPQSDSASDIG